MGVISIRRYSRWPTVAWQRLHDSRSGAAAAARLNDGRSVE
jgi:hypothetical protein